ncbi:hypothetical protein CNR22_09050 [Sphingobacteriaceae bacterium]|nr:hypothetical protein CNR22_09050 [Sphingobacteriaceae bacterium]
MSVLDSNSNLFNGREIELPINSEKYIRFSKWVDNNINDWQSTSASYVPADIIVSQDSFQLLYWAGQDGAVISFTDKNNNPKQYMKLIKKGSLDFLAK